MNPNDQSVSADNERSSPQLSFVLPAYNEEANIGPCVDDLLKCIVGDHGLTAEVIVVNDNSSDQTEREVLKISEKWPGCVRLIRRNPPGGFGRAIRTGLTFATGQVVVIYMADRSDHPEDALAYYQKIEEGYDCVFGSRFVKGSRVQRYPKVKLIVNRAVNKCAQWMFWTPMNDLTNAFKAYRREVVQTCGPYKACHFNITLEMSLSALIGGYKIAQIPIDWEGRSWGSTNLRMREMGRRYLCTLLMLFFQRILMSDDVKSERFGKTTLATEVPLDAAPPTSNDPANA